MQQCNIPITTSSIKIQISHCIFHKFAYLFDVPLLPHWYSLWHPTQLFIWHPTQLIWELLKSQASPFDIAHVTCFLLSTTTICKTLSLLNLRNILSQTFYTFNILQQFTCVCMPVSKSDCTTPKHMRCVLSIIYICAHKRLPRRPIIIFS